MKKDHFNHLLHTDQDTYTTNPYTIYEVEEEIIIAETKEQAIENYMSRIVDVNPEDLNIGTIPPETIGYFEQPDGSMKEMTYQEFIDQSLEGEPYYKPMLICWVE